MHRHEAKDQAAGGPGMGVLGTRKRMLKEQNGTTVTNHKSQKQSHGRKSPGQPRNALPGAGVEEADRERDKLLSPISQEFDSLSADGPMQGVSFIEEEANPPSPHASRQCHDLGRDQVGSGLQGAGPIDMAAASNELNDIFYIDTGMALFSSSSSSSLVGYLVGRWLRFKSEIMVVNDPFIANSFNIMPFTANFDWLLDVPPSTIYMLSNETINEGMSAAAPRGSKPDSIEKREKVTGPFSSYDGLEELSAADVPGGMEAGTKTADSQPTNFLVDPGFNSQDCSRSSANIHPLSYETEISGSVNVNSRSSRKSNELPIISIASRESVLDLIGRARPRTIDGEIIDRSSRLLSPYALQEYCDLFFTRFNTSYPLIHTPTFEISQADPLILTSLLLLGATYSGKDAHQMAVGVHDSLRAQIIQHPSFSEHPELWVLQTILLVDCFGTSRAGQRQHAMSNMFHGLLINLIRRADCQNIRTSSPGSADLISADLHDMWRREMELEQRKRLVLLCFLWDTQHAVLFSQASCLSAIELRLSLPCDSRSWEATTAEGWWESRQTNPVDYLFLPVLKAYLSAEPTARPRYLDGFSRTLILHGLMSVSSDLKRRNQASLGIKSLYLLALVIHELTSSFCTRY